MTYNDYHRLLRDGEDLSILDNADGLTHDEVIRLVQDYIRFEKMFVGDPARKIVQSNIVIAKQSNKRVKDASIYLSNLIANHATIQN